MKVIVVKDYEAMSELGAQIIGDMIKNNPSCTLGLATGSSPIGTYKNLIKAYENQEISFKNVTKILENNKKRIDLIVKLVYNLSSLNVENKKVPDGTIRKTKNEVSWIQKVDVPKVLFEFNSLRKQRRRGENENG